MNTRPFYFGLIFIAIIAILANYLGNTDFSHHYHISALIIAILLGMAIGNTIYPQFSTQVEKGVLFAKGALLRTGIVLYGFRLTFGDIADVRIKCCRYRCNHANFNLLFYRTFRHSLSKNG